MAHDALHLASSLAAIVPFGICLLAPLAIGVFIVIGVLAYKAEQRRQAEFLSVAQEHGLQFLPDSEVGWSSRWPRFECFQRGHSRRAFNLLTGRLNGGGPQCVLGEYQFKETHGSGKNRRTVTYTFGFVILDIGARGAPDVLIRREHLLDKVAGFLGFDDIDFESAEFSRAFMVKSPDKRFAYDLIDAQMMEFLLGAGTPNIDIGGNVLGASVCLWHGQSKRLAPRELVQLATWGASFLERWPRVARARLAEQVDGDGRRSDDSRP